MIKFILKKIYRSLPYKKQLFQIIKKVVSLPEKVYRHLHFEGEIEVSVSELQSFKMFHYGYIIENEIFWKGLYDGWEKNSMKVWAELSKDADVIIDIGANTGLYSLVSKSINPKAQVFAFEPVQRVFEKMLKNIELNQFDIQSIKKAVSSSNGKAIIHDADTPHTLSVSVNKNISLTPENTFEVEIDTITLDSFISETKLDKIDLLKIDVETHEVEVFKGFIENLKPMIPNILVEILNEEVRAGISKIIEGMDYTFFNIDEEKGIREAESLEVSDYYNVLLCKPEDAMRVRSKFQTNIEAS